MDSEILNILEAIEALKSKNILFSKSKFFKLQANNKVLVVDVNVKYSLTIEEFLDLYKKEEFVIYKDEKEESVDNKKDEEYYSWEHK